MNETQQTQQTQPTQQNEELGALWKRTSQQGQKYLAGHIKVGEFGEEQSVKVVVFSNGHKQKDSQPDFRIYKSKPRGDSSSTEQKPSSSETEASETEEQSVELL